MSDEDYMRLALAQAEIAITKGNWPIGCVLVLDGEVIAANHNLVYSSENRLAHAEMQALESSQAKIFRRPGEAVLYTTYEPCPMCLGACLNSRLRRVVYGVDLNDSGAIKTLEHMPSIYLQGEFGTEFVGGVLAAECEAVYRKGEAAVLKTRQAVADSSNLGRRI